jgi:hypothetical protein
MGYCRDCKWWGRPLPDYVDDRVGWCELIGRGGRGGRGRLTWPSLAISQATLHTAPHFGCVQFAPKDNTQAAP